MAENPQDEWHEREGFKLWIEDDRFDELGVQQDELMNEDLLSDDDWSACLRVDSSTEMVSLACAPAHKNASPAVPTLVQADKITNRLLPEVSDASDASDDNSSAGGSVKTLTTTTGGGKVDVIFNPEEERARQLSDINKGCRFILPCEGPIDRNQGKVCLPCAPPIPKKNFKGKYNMGRKIPVRRSILQQLEPAFLKKKENRNLKEAAFPKQPRNLTSDLTKGPQDCNKCGVPRRGHTCTFVGVRISDIRNKIFPNLPVQARMELVDYLTRMYHQMKGEGLLPKPVSNKTKNNLDQDPALSLEELSSLISELAHVRDANAASDAAGAKKNARPDNLQEGRTSKRRKM